jgi:integrase
VWNSDEIRVFLSSVRDDRFAALFLLELATGIRRGQICGLRWAAIDLQVGKITVHDNRVVVGGQALDKAGGKTRNADQTISIDRATVAALKHWRDLQDSEREFFGDAFHPGDFVSRTRTVGLFIRTRFDSVSTDSPPQQACRASPFTICAIRMPPARFAPG